MEKIPDSRESLSSHLLVHFFSHAFCRGGGSGGWRSGERTVSEDPRRNQGPRWVWGSVERGWEEDRAGPLALPQREAAEDHGSYSIQRSAFQFLLCLLSIMDPIPRDSLGWSLYTSSPCSSAGE